MAQEINIPMPPDLDVGATYKLRVTAVDPTSGALVSGVNINAVTFTVDAVAFNPSDLSQLATGDWSLLPGPSA